MKRRKLSAADYRATLDAFLPPSDCDTNHEEPMTAKLRPIFEGQAKERQQIRKGSQAGATPEKLPDLKPSDARDAAGEALNVSERAEANSQGRAGGRKCGKFATVESPRRRRQWPRNRTWKICHLRSRTRKGAGKFTGP